MGRIHVLDDAVINKIAAGEVVERPASVVKEMVENAIDAGATAISVSLEQGGTASIVVSDNGSGMDADDARMALRRHATSKIATADDLFCIQSMGFRGEALASIAAVSRFSLATVPAGADRGTKVETEGGESLRELPWTGPQGTTIAVESLFYNVPARAKFLKAPATELSFCLELMQSFALSHPHVGFTLLHNKKEQLRVPALVKADPTTAHAANVASPLKGEGPLRDRAKAVIGKDASLLMYVTAESRYGVVEALVSPPGVEKATSKYMFTFVNGRWVKEKTLRYGVLRGYHSHLLKGRFPIALVYLTLDPALVDVNAHPAKTEVRFQYPGEVQNLIALAIREKIRSGVWAQAPQMPTGTRSRAQSMARSLDDDGASSLLAAAEAPSDLDLRSLEPTGETRDTARGGGSGSWQSPSKTFGLSSGDRSRLGSSSAPSRYTSLAFGTGEEDRPEWTDSLPPKAKAPRAPVVDKASLEALLASQPEPFLREGEEVETAPWTVETSPPVVSRVAGSTIPWDELTYVGTFDRCFLLFEGAGRLLVVDQHAFHERILYERLTRDQALLAQSQKLLVPEALDMQPSDVAHLLEEKDALGERGFDFAAEGPGTLVVTAVPSLLAGRDLAGLFDDLAKGLKAEHGGQEPGDSNAELARLVLATAACHGAVRAGEELPPNELKQLLKAAREVDFVENCPHGRRVFRWWTRSQVAGWFDR